MIFSHSKIDFLYSKNLFESEKSFFQLISRKSNIPEIIWLNLLTFLRQTLGSFKVDRSGNFHETEISQKKNFHFYLLENGN